MHGAGQFTEKETCQSSLVDMYVLWRHCFLMTSNIYSTSLSCTLVSFNIFKTNQLTKNDQNDQMFCSKDTFMMKGINANLVIPVTALLEMLG